MGTDPTPPTPPPCFPQSAALECSFGQEEIFEAVWVNESAVRCNQVVVSGVASEGAGEDLHKSRYCTAFFPSSLFPPLVPAFPVALSSSVSMTSPPQQRLGRHPHPSYFFPSFLQLHTTQKSQVFPLSLQLKGQSARFLDSPDPMTGWSPHPPRMATRTSATMGGAKPGSAHCIDAPHHHPQTGMDAQIPALPFNVWSLSTY